MSTDAWDGRFQRRKLWGNRAFVAGWLVGFPLVATYWTVVVFGATDLGWLNAAAFFGGIVMVGCFSGWVYGELPPWAGNCTAKQIDDDIAAVLRGDFLPADLSRMALRIDLLNKKFRLEWLMKWMERIDRCHAELELERINLEFLERDQARRVRETEQANTRSPRQSVFSAIEQATQVVHDAVAQQVHLDLRTLHSVETSSLALMLSILRRLGTPHAEHIRQLVTAKLDERKPNLCIDGYPAYPVEQIALPDFRVSVFTYMTLYEKQPTHLLINQSQVSEFMSMCRAAAQVGERVAHATTPLGEVVFLGMQCEVTNKMTHVCCLPEAVEEPVAVVQPRTPLLRRFDI